LQIDILGATVIFYVPLLRDINLWCGGRDGLFVVICKLLPVICIIFSYNINMNWFFFLLKQISVTRHSIDDAISHNRSILLIPGGQREMRLSRSSSPNVEVVTKHKGFIRVAFRYGLFIFF
jgi:hypothetical protein